MVVFLAVCVTSARAVTPSLVEAVAVMESDDVFRLHDVNGYETLNSGRVVQRLSQTRSGGSLKRAVKDCLSTAPAYGPWERKILLAITDGSEKAGCSLKQLLSVERDCSIYLYAVGKKLPEWLGTLCTVREATVEGLAEALKLDYMENVQ